VEKWDPPLFRDKYRTGYCKVHDAQDQRSKKLQKRHKCKGVMTTGLNKKQNVTEIKSKIEIYNKTTLDEQN